MTIHASIDGPIGSVGDVQFNQDGKARLRFTVASNRRRLNRQTNEWENDGATTWLSATLFGRDAEMWGERLNKGDKVSLIGEFTTHEWTDRDGGERKDLQVVFPTIVDHRPKAQPQGGQQYAQPVSDDPWRAQGQPPQPPQQQSGWGPEQGFPQQQSTPAPF